ncbi:MAG: hypothetical protein L6R42_004958 [Xanthoria sp. 1 TBL-2021]|nr:MAG: hypothetical protein L6R42_004958 [Xanthoria sp. 1 TBL-2021]
MPSSAYLIHPEVHTSFLSPTALQNLHYTTNIPIPSTKDIPPKHALVRIRAAAVNPRDMMVIALDRETYPVKEANGIAPCADGAGEIEAVGEGSYWKKGERVIVQPSGWMDGDVPELEGLKVKGAEDVEGTLRDFMVLEDSHLHRAPDHLSFTEMAALPVAGGTAVNTLLFGPVPLKKGMVVLTQGTGGIASALGATVIVTSSSDEKLGIARKLGATHGINYRKTPDWEEEVLRLTNGKGVDHAVEIGGAQSIEQSVRATKQGGLISLVGILSEDRALNLIGPILFGAKTGELHSFSSRLLISKKREIADLGWIVRGVLGVNTAMLAKLLETVQEHQLHPSIAKEFKWKHAKEAFEYSIGWSGVGKILIKVGD